MPVVHSSDLFKLQFMAIMSLVRLLIRGVPTAPIHTTRLAEGVCSVFLILMDARVLQVTWDLTVCKVQWFGEVDFEWIDCSGTDCILQFPNREAISFDIISFRMP